MTARIGVVTFPGSLDDQDARRAVRQAGGEPVVLWHGDADLHGVDAVILPGGFSYGDYLRCGAIARFAPVMSEIVPAAGRGLPVLGICNGFQILCEAGLLPGALLRNDSLQFRCQPTKLLVEDASTPFLAGAVPGSTLAIPISHGEGRYYADEETLRDLNSSNRVAFRYCSSSGEVGPAHNPNGSLDDIAGIVNEAGNVLGMMPHPERACEPLLGSSDGLALFTALVKGAAGLPT